MIKILIVLNLQIREKQLVDKFKQNIHLKGGFT